MSELPTAPEEAPRVPQSDSPPNTATSLSDANRSDASFGHPPAPKLEAGVVHLARVLAREHDVVVVDVGADCRTVMSAAHFASNSIPPTGATLEVVVDAYDRHAGLMRVSPRPRPTNGRNNGLVPGATVEGKVVGMYRGGLEVDINGTRAFMPPSHIDVMPMKDVSVLIGQTVRCTVLEHGGRDGNVHVSRRKAIARQHNEHRANLIASLSVGQFCTGVVGNVTEFGVFVDLGGVDGLIHRRDLSWSLFSHPSDIVRTGQQVTVKVLKVDPGRVRVSLGRKQVTPDPWNDIDKRYPVGTRLPARVVRLAEFGVFVRVEDDLEGLIPLSELSWGRVDRVADVVAVNDQIEAQVIRLEPKKRRLALSLKRAQTNPWEAIKEEFSPEKVVTGKVTRLVDYGVFVELAPGVEGLVHISELSNRHIKQCSDVVSPGQEIRVRILRVAPQQRRISLSVKAALPKTTRKPTPQRVVKTEPERQPPENRVGKSKKQLRGGLASSWSWEGSSLRDMRPPRR